MKEPELFDVIKNLNHLNEKLAAFIAVEEYKSTSPARKLALEYINSDTAARILHISPRTLAKMRAKGQLPFTRVGRKIVYNTDDLRKILSNKSTR